MFAKRADILPKKNVAKKIVARNVAVPVCRLCSIKCGFSSGVCPKFYATIIRPRVPVKIWGLNKIFAITLTTTFLMAPDAERR